MNILFVGPYRNFCGWSFTARTILKALILTGHNITARPVYTSQKIKRDLPYELMELEFNKYDNYDIVIQNVLPHMADYSSHFDRNILTADFETSNLQYTSWPARINNMDEIWVTSHTEARSLDKSGVRIPIKTIGQSVDIDIFDQEYKLNVNYDGFKNQFVFYFIGEWITRKGISELLIAYLSEFNCGDDVNLVIKTSVNKELFSKTVEQTKQYLGMYADPSYYPPISLINQFLTEYDLYAIHQNFDCCVIPSFGESFCIPAIEAMLFGKTPIITDNTGMADFIDDDCGYVIWSEETVVCSADRPLADIYTGFETWMRPDILDLRRAMREAYSDPKIRNEKAQNGIERRAEFSHEKFAETLKTILES